MARERRATDWIHLKAAVERKHPALPRFLVVSSEMLAAWELGGTTVVDVVLEGVGLGRRSLKRWEERGGWFIDLTASQCEAADVDTGDRVSLHLRMADTARPDEISALIDARPEAAQAWARLTSVQQRQLAEHVREAKRQETRVRRAFRALIGA